MKIAAKALIYNDQNQILVLYRSETHPYHPHQLDFPGGLIDRGETPLMAVVREIREETGIVIGPADLSLAKNLRVNPFKVDELFIANITGRPDVILSWEHEAFKWLSESVLLEKLAKYRSDSFSKIAYDWLSKKLAG